jgi:hypothetical protein
VTDDEVLDILTEIDNSRSADKAEQFEAMAESLAPGENGRASFLSAAGDHWQMQDQPDRARVCFEAALADGGESAVNPLVSLLDLALAHDDDERSAALTEQLRDMVRRDELDALGCHQVGETYEIHGQLKVAARWFTFPLSWVDPEDEELLDDLCLFGRVRVREQLGLPSDRYDLVAKRWIAERAVTNDRA